MKLKIRPLHRLIYIALLAAIAMVCMMVFGLKLIPGASYLKYEPSGAVILLCGMILGPVGGLQCALIKNILYFLAHGGSPYGHISDFIATVALVIPASGLMHALCWNQGWKKVLCCAAGCLAATLIMIPANYLILHLQYGMSAEAVTASMVYIVPFNILKGLLNSVIATALYGPVIRALKKY